MTILEKSAAIIKGGYIDEIFKDAEKLKKVIEATCNIQYYGSNEVGLIRLNSCQHKIINKVVAQYKAGEAVRIMIAKSRRVGGSMLSAILSSLLMMGKENFRALVASYEKERVSEFLGKLYTILLDYLPDELEEFKGPKKRKQQGSGYSLIHNGSILAVDREAEVRGRATDFLHCSEFAYFKDGRVFLNAYRPTLPEVHGTFAILESTPRNYDDNFHRMFEQALNGDSAYAPLFFPWQEFEENYMACSAQEEEEIMNKLHKSHPKYGNEVQLVNTFDVTAGQIKWRRNFLKDGDLESFKKEYPSSIEEAFSAADSRNVFDMAVLREMKTSEPEEQGEMNVNRPLHWQKVPELVSQPQGLIQIWEQPDLKKEYVAGSDHSLGRGDWNSLTICQRMPLRVVATLHGDRTRRNVIPAEFAQQMLHLLKYYNEPYTNIEINDTGLVVSTQLREWEYPHLLNHQTIFPDDTLNEVGGWRNTTKTRSYAIERLRYYIQNKLIHIPDPLTVKELMHFVYTSPGGDLSKEKAQAARKGQRPRGVDVTGLYDDRVFSLISALLAHEALQPALTAREMAIERNQTDRDELYPETAIDTDQYDFGGLDFDLELPAGWN